jgi:hypothetical protein
VGVVGQTRVKSNIIGKSIKAPVGERHAALSVKEQGLRHKGFSVSRAIPAGIISSMMMINCAMQWSAPRFTGHAGYWGLSSDELARGAHLEP